MSRALWWGCIGIAAGALGYALSGCAASSSAAKSSATTRAVMVSAIDAAAHAYNAAVEVCLAPDAGPTPKQCAAALQPVHDMIIEAYVATQVYTDADAQNLPCLLQDVATGLATVGNLLKNPPQSLHDAALIANQFSVACVRPVDAGAQ